MGKHDKITLDDAAWVAPGPLGEPPLSAPPASPAPPASDVSAMVGWVGLAGLLAWVLLCRNWPAIADTFGLPGPRFVLSGPYAALAALAFSAVPMAAWSLVVDKVHRDPSTGIDWAHPRAIADIIDISTTKLIGLWATWGLIGFVYCVERFYWQGQWRFAMDMLGTMVVPMVVLSVPYVLWLDRVLVQPRDASWHFGALLLGRRAADIAQVRHHARAWAVKGFYIAFMLSILSGGFSDVVTFDWHQALANPVAMTNWLIEGLFMIDVQIGMVGYLLTFRPLGAHIRSANPLLAGWLSALICYPPFVLMNDGGPLGYHVNTADWSYWLAGHPGVEWAWGAWMVALTAVYAWATMAFGIRFSNLTYRGILTNGPYRYTRHPAYLSKNIFWWCSVMPFMVTTHSWIDGLRDCALMAAMSGVYYWRARTEEQHLAAADPKYGTYHAWMAEHGAITSRLTKLGRWLTARYIRSR